MHLHRLHVALLVGGLHDVDAALRSVQCASVEAEELREAVAGNACALNAVGRILADVGQTEVVHLEPALSVESAVSKGQAFSIHAVGAETNLGHSVLAHGEGNLHRVQQVAVVVAILVGSTHVACIGQLTGVLGILRQVQFAVGFLRAPHLHVVVAEDALCGGVVASPVMLNHHIGLELVGAHRHVLERLAQLHFGNVRIPDTPQILTVGVLMVNHGTVLQCNTDVVAMVDGAPSAADGLCLFTVHVERPSCGSVY